jgi:hypothetical protein
MYPAGDIISIANQRQHLAILYDIYANVLLGWCRGGAAGYGTARKTVCKRNVKNRRMPTRTRDYAPASLLIASDSIN